MSNYSFIDPDIADSSVIGESNFTQLTPDTEIMKGKTLTINGGNFCNVKLQPEWTINGGLWIKRSFCSHLHSDWIEKGLTECDTECSHMVEKEDIIIDGQVVDTIYTYEDTLI